MKLIFKDTDECCQLIDIKVNIVLDCVVYPVKSSLGQKIDISCEFIRQCEAIL